MKDEFDEFNFIDYQKLLKSEREERRRAIESIIDEDLKKKFRSRKSYFRRDPKISNWWLDYVRDERGTFRDPNHRDGRLFMYRFSFSFLDMKELIKKVKEPGESFWKSGQDAAGRESSPIDLLVLGSMRILTRNVTLDDLYEQTFISAEVHALVQHSCFSRSC
jgi:hypothetical protein